MHRMYDVGESLHGALDASDARLRDAQTLVARANSGAQVGRGADAAMAATAQAAIFTEAILAAERARFEAIKAATK